MKRLMKVIILLFSIILLSCSSKNINRDIYNALQQRECIQTSGEPNCDSGQPSYEEYQREREEIKSQE